MKLNTFIVNIFTILMLKFQFFSQLRLKKISKNINSNIISNSNLKKNSLESKKSKKKV